MLHLHGIVADAECQLLIQEANVAAEVRRQVRARAGAFASRQPRFRMPVANFLSTTTGTLSLADEILRRALVRIADAMGPEWVSERLGEATESCERCIIGSSTLQFSEGEPAINVYHPGGEFLPHEDKQRLTILIALSDAASGAFSGGGTAFWSEEDRGPDGSNAKTVPPTRTVHAPAGTALIFCGVVTHGALPVVSGQRTVFVASFGPRGQDYRRASRLSRLRAAVGRLLP